MKNKHWIHDHLSLKTAWPGQAWPQPFTSLDFGRRGAVAFSLGACAPQSYCIIWSWDRPDPPFPSWDKPCVLGSTLLFPCKPISRVSLPRLREKGVKQFNFCKEKLLESPRSQAVSSQQGHTSIEEICRNPVPAFPVTNDIFWGTWWQFRFNSCTEPWHRQCFVLLSE